MLSDGGGGGGREGGECWHLTMTRDLAVSTARCILPTLVQGGSHNTQRINKPGVGHIILVIVRRPLKT